MSKHISRIITIAILFFSLSILMPVHAENLGFIEVKASVPNDFNRSIMLNFFSESDGHNSLFTLNSSNQYQLKEKMPVGKYRLDFVSIYGDNKNEFTVISDKNITITSNGLTVYPVTIQSNGNDEKLTETKAETVASKNIADNKSTIDVKEKEPKTFWQQLFSNTFTIVLTLILGIIYLIIKYRKVRYDE